MSIDIKVYACRLIMPPDSVETGMNAVWKDTVVAESDDTMVVEGNYYFPAEAVKNERRSAQLRPCQCGSCCLSCQTSPWAGNVLPSAESLSSSARARL